MPRRMQRALAQMDEVLQAWSGTCQGEGDEVAAGRWSALAQIARPSELVARGAWPGDPGHPDGIPSYQVGRPGADLPSLGERQNPTPRS